MDLWLSSSYYSSQGSGITFGGFCTLDFIGRDSLCPNLVCVCMLAIVIHSEATSDLFLCRAKRGEKNRVKRRFPAVVVITPWLEQRQQSWDSKTIMTVTEDRMRNFWIGNDMKKPDDDVDEEDPLTNAIERRAENQESRRFRYSLFFTPMMRWWFP